MAEPLDKSIPLELQDRDPWLLEEYGGRPIAPRILGELDDEDFARIGSWNLVFEPAVWCFAGYVLQGNAWNSVYDILGYWMILAVMLPLRLLDTDRPRDQAFRVQYIALQALSLAGGFVGWRLARLRHGL